MTLLCDNLENLLNFNSYLTDSLQSIGFVAFFGMHLDAYIY